MLKRNLAARAAVALLFGIVNSGAANAGLKIVDHFGPSIENASNAAAIELAITETTNSIARLYSNDVTVNILFQQAPISLGAQSQETFYAWDTADYNAASAFASLAHPENLPLAEGLQHLSSGNGYPTPGNPAPNLITVSTALRALGLDTPGTFDLNGNDTGAPGPLDGVITLTTSVPLDYDQNVPAYDGTNFEYNGRNFIAHEVNEVLGIGGAGSNLNRVYFFQNGGTTGSAFWDNFFMNAVSPLDRFRYQAPGVPSFTTDLYTPAYFSLDGGVTDLADFNTYFRGDYGDLAILSACAAGGFGGLPQYDQNAFNCYNLPTVPIRRGSIEDVMLQSIGWNPAPEPSTWAMLMIGIAMIGVSVRRAGRNLAIAA